MTSTTNKRKLDSFFTPIKKTKYTTSEDPPTTHPTYPFPIPQFPPEIHQVLGCSPAAEVQHINDKSDLDLDYYQPYISKEITSGVFTFLRRELPFYRVQYTINRFGKEVDINTPRFTTVFGVDATAKFDEQGNLRDSKTGRLLGREVYG